jgi:hypothetical protein
MITKANINAMKKLYTRNRGGFLGAWIEDDKQYFVGNNGTVFFKINTPLIDLETIQKPNENDISIKLFDRLEFISDCESPDIITLDAHSTEQKNIRKNIGNKQYYHRYFINEIPFDPDILGQVMKALPKDDYRFSIRRYEEFMNVLYIESDLMTVIVLSLRGLRA